MNLPNAVEEVVSQVRAVLLDSVTPEETHRRIGSLRAWMREQEEPKHYEAIAG